MKKVWQSWVVVRYRAFLDGAELIAAVNCFNCTTMAERHTYKESGDQDTTTEKATIHTFATSLSNSSTLNELVMETTPRKEVVR